MADREQVVEHEKQVSRLSNREIGEVDERSSPSAKIVHKREQVKRVGFVGNEAYARW
jgi:hypothetical protein